MICRKKLGCSASEQSFKCVKLAPQPPVSWASTSKIRKRASSMAAGTPGPSRVGLAVKNALLLPNETVNRYFCVEILTVSQSDVVGSLEKAMGNPWEREHVDAEEMKRSDLEKMSKGDDSGMVSLIRYVNCVPGHGGNYAEDRGTADGVLGLPNATLDEEVRTLVSRGW